MKNLQDKSCIGSALSFRRILQLCHEGNSCFAMFFLWKCFMISQLPFMYLLLNLFLHCSLLLLFHSFPYKSLLQASSSIFSAQFPCQLRPELWGINPVRLKNLQNYQIQILNHNDLIYVGNKMTWNCTAKRCLMYNMKNPSNNTFCNVSSFKLWV